MFGHHEQLKTFDNLNITYNKGTQIITEMRNHNTIGYFNLEKNEV